MRKALLIPVAALVLGLATHGVAGAQGKAIGAVFGYPGNIGLSMRFGPMPINIAWSEDFLHGTIDKWAIKKPLGEEERLDWYFGPGVDAGIPLDDNEDFFLAVRAPIGLQFMLTPKIETFGEVAAGLQVFDDVDFYWASSIGIRFMLGN